MTGNKAVFSYGGNHELRGTIYIAYPLEALLYDAIKGVPLSRRCILSLYSEKVSSGEVVPPQIAHFIAGILGAIADGKLASDALINPQGLHSKTAPLSPAIVDLVEVYRKGGAVPLTGSKRSDGAIASAAKAWAGVAGLPLVQQTEYLNMGVRPTGKVRAVPEKTLERLYRRQILREKRISRVQSLLDKFYDESALDRYWTLSREFLEETNKIYADLAKMD